MYHASRSKRLGTQIKHLTCTLLPSIVIRSLYGSTGARNTYYDVRNITRSTPNNKDFYCCNNGFTLLVVITRSQIPNGVFIGTLSMVTFNLVDAI